MNPKAQQLKTKADQAKSLYLQGEISYDEVKASVTEYIDFCNERAVAIAKEYGMKPRKMSVNSYMR